MSCAIEVRELRRRFGNFEAVRGVSFDVKKGEIFGYLGANGAGKSTTIRVLCGLLAPSSGHAQVAGFDVARDPDSVRMAVGYMSQKFSLYPDLTALENLDFFGGAYQIPRKVRLKRAAELLDAVGMTAYAGTITASLPGGIRQRLALATSLVHEPKIVFLDEPTAGVDPQARRRFWRLIRGLSSNGTTVFVTTHYMDEAEYCSRVGMMVDGHLVALDTPENLKRDYVPGQIFAVRGRNLPMQQLVSLQGVQAVEPFGAGLHVRANRDQVSEASIAAVLEQHGAQGYSVEKIAATLEDVFLALASRTEQPS